MSYDYQIWSEEPLTRVKYIPGLKGHAKVNQGSNHLGMCYDYKLTCMDYGLPSGLRLRRLQRAQGRTDKNCYKNWSKEPSNDKEENLKKQTKEQTKQKKK